MNSEEILKVVGTGVVAAALTVGLTWLKETLSARRTRIYSAIQVAVALERFALACSSELAANNLTNQQLPPGEEETIPPSFPDFPSYPPDVDWKSLPPDLMAEAIAMANDVENKRQNLTFLWNATGDADDYSLISIQRIAETAIFSIDLAKKLRSGVRTTFNLERERMYLEGVRHSSEKRFKDRGGADFG